MQQQIEEVPIETRLAIIESELQMWRNERFMQGLRHKMQKRLGGGPDTLKPIEEMLVKCEGMIDGYELELKSLGK